MIFSIKIIYPVVEWEGYKHKHIDIQTITINYINSTINIKRTNLEMISIKVKWEPPINKELNSLFQMKMSKTT